MILSKDSFILFIEVKSLHNDWMIFDRVKSSQIKKIKQNVSYYQNSNEYKMFEIRPLVVYVNRSLKKMNIVQI